MKTNYQFKTSRDRKNKKVFQKALSATVLALVLVGILVWAPHGSGAVVNFLGVPVWKTEAFLAEPFIFIKDIFVSKQALVAENIQLRNELASADIQLKDRQALQDENTSLKSILGRADNEHLILAAVLERPNQTPYDTLIIDGGKQAGIAIGSEVLSEDAVLIGSVSDVYADSARVTLFSTPGIKVQVLVGASHIKATAEGQGGGNFTIKLPRSATVAVGDTITAPDLRIKLFGSVSHIEVTPSDSFQTLYFNSPVNVNQLRFVSVVKQ